MEQLYTTKSLADLMQVSPTTIRREMNEGRIAWFKVRGQIRFRETEVQRYLQQSKGRRTHLSSANVVYMPFRITSQL